MGPGEIEDAVGEVTVLVFFDQADGHLAGIADAQNEIDRCRLLGIQNDTPADGNDRIQYRSFAVRERHGVAHRQGSAAVASAPDEAQAIGFIGRLPGFRAVHRHQMQHPGCLFAERAGPARA